MGFWIRRQDGPVSVISLLRPPVNALNQDALDELAETVKAIGEDTDTRVLIVTSGLDGTFCAGGDLKHWRENQDAKAVGRAGREVFELIERLPIPVIAAINGHVFGDGLSLALACDLRIASSNATIRLPEVAYGFIPGWGLIPRLVTLVGKTYASELLLYGQPLEASKALSMGLLNDVVSSNGLMDEVLKKATLMAAHSPSALRAAKCAILGGDEKACFEAVWGQEDWREGIEALLSRRTPVFGPCGKG